MADDELIAWCELPKYEDGSTAQVSNLETASLCLLTTPAAIVNLSECRARDWEYSALAYRSSWNDCRRAALGEAPLGYAGCHELATSVGVKS